MTAEEDEVSAKQTEDMESSESEDIVGPMPATSGYYFLDIVSR
jgi:hypothetical protein